MPGVPDLDDEFDPAAPAPDPARSPGLRTQVGKTIAAVRGLVSSHVELAKAEAGDILDEVKRTAVLAGLAVGLLVLVGFLLPVGLMLFLGEWLFGSIGWGVLHGTLLLVGLAVAAVLVALGIGGGTVARDLAIGILLGVAVGVLFGLDLTNLGWTRLGEQVAPATDPAIRPLAVGAGALAVVGAVLGLVLGGRRGGMGGALAGLLAGALLGAVAGAFSAIAFGPQVGAALGVVVALVAWLALMAGDARRVDAGALKDRFYPRQTIETTKETIEWVREQTPLGRES